jgi:HK97 family phage major capsid protein
MSYEINEQINTMDQKGLSGFIETKFKEMEKMAGSDGDGLKSLDTDGVEEFQTRDKELALARKRYGTLREASDTFKKQREEHQKSFMAADRRVPFQTGNGNGGGELENPEDAFKSLGERFCESTSYTGLDRENVNLRITGNLQSEIGGVTIKSLESNALKATMATTAGWAPYPQLSARPPVLSGLQQPVVADLIPQDDTTQPAILWYEETSFSDNAAATAEGATKPEGQLGLTLRTQPVIKVAVTLPITDEQLMDVPQIRGYIDQRLTLMVKRAEERELLGGSGVSPHLMGFHNKVGIGSIARGVSEDNPDAILRAITDVNNITGYANVTGIIMNPLQWLAIRLLRTKTGDYIWGHPALQGPATLWGLPVISTNAETAGRALVGDFQMYSHISRRLGIRIDVGYINDDFTKDIQRIRLEERLSLEIYRAAAFEEITNLNAAPTT